MKTMTFIGLVAFTTSISAFANAIVFPDSENNARIETEIVFPKDKTPVPLVGGYQIENGILTSRTYNCGINISDLDIEAKLQWNGATPQLLIVGVYPSSMCRAGFTGPRSVDLAEFIHSIPAHVLDRLVVANHSPLDL